MFEDGGGFFTLLIGIGFLAPLLVVGLVVLGVVAISKADFDPSGRRPYAFYLFAVSFVALFTMVYSAAGMITTLTELVGDDDDSAIFFDDSSSSGSSSDNFNSDDDFSFDEDSGIDSGSSGSGRGQVRPQTDFEDERNDEIIRTAAQAGTVGLVALGLFAFHWTRARRMVDEPDFAGSPASRVYNAYLYVVCFVAAITILIAGAIALYGVFRVAFPEIASSGISDDAEREGGLRQLASAGVVLAIGLLLALTHWRQIQRPAARAALGPGGPKAPSGPVGGTSPEYPPPSGQYTPGGSPAAPPPPPYPPGATPYQRPV